MFSVIVNFLSSLPFLIVSGFLFLVSFVIIFNTNLEDHLISKIVCPLFIIWGIWVLFLIIFKPSNDTRKYIIVENIGGGNYIQCVNNKKYILGNSITPLLDKDNKTVDCKVEEITGEQLEKMKIDDTKYYAIYLHD